VNALYFFPDRQFDDSTIASFAGNSPPVAGVDAAEDRGEVPDMYFFEWSFIR